MEEHRRKNDFLSCGCGCCHEEDPHQQNKVAKERGGFFKNYGIELIKVGLSLVVFLLALFLPLPFYVRLALYVLSALICGYEILYSCVKNLCHGAIFDENTLMIVASVVAFILGDFFEGCIIVILFTVGEFLEKIATDNSRKRIAGLASLKSTVAHLVDRNGITDVDPNTVKIGSILEVKAGDMVAIDGVVWGGSCLLDMKAVTGESNPCDLSHGEAVYSGALNVGNAFYVKTTKEYKDSTVEKIISLVEEGSAQKAKSQKFIKSFAKIYTPIVVMLALIVGGVIPLLDHMNFTKWIYKALSFLVISCPCALVISVPLSYFVSLGTLAKQGVLVKGGNHLDVLAECKTIAFDKTGTLTHGEFSVNSFEVYEEFDSSKILQITASIEQNSNHPLAKAIVKYFGNKSFLPVENFCESVGKGAFGIVEGKEILVGSAKFMHENEIKMQENDGSQTLIFVAVNKRLAGSFGLKDKIKENALNAVEKLKEQGFKRSVILSGDNQKVVENVRIELNLSECYYGLLPEQKVEKINEIKGQTKRKVIFCGDGINDSPVIAAADVGIAMGGLGSQIAIECADVVVMDDNLEKISFAVKKARKNRAIVLQNIIGSVNVKLAIMTLSITLGIPVWLSMFADVGVMLLAMLNSLRNYIN